MIADLPVGQINDSSLGKCYSLLFLPATLSSLSRTFEGLFELTRSPLRALNLDAYVASELQRNKDTVGCAALGAEVPGQRQEQLTQTLIVFLCKTLLFLFFWKLKGGPFSPFYDPLVDNANGFPSSMKVQPCLMQEAHRRKVKIR